MRMTYSQNSGSHSVNFTIKLNVTNKKMPQFFTDDTKVFKF